MDMVVLLLDSFVFPYLIGLGLWWVLLRVIMSYEPDFDFKSFWRTGLVGIAVGTVLMSLIF